MRAATLTAVGAPGLGGLLAGEMAELGLISPRLARAEEMSSGRVEFVGGAAAMMRANFRLRLAERVFERLAEFRAASAPELARGLSRVDWKRVLAPGAGLRTRLRARGTPLNCERAVAALVARAAGARPTAEPGAALVGVDIDGERARVEFDTSGEPLHRRGYRLATAKAPLKETLAAALLAAAGWDGRAALFDPMCGSGTIAIEAALRASGIAPGARRRFAFEARPDLDAAAWSRERARAEPCARPFPRLVAADRDAGAVAAARANAERAGVGGRIEFSVRALSEAPAIAGPGLLAVNPPYGERVGAGRDLRALYARLGEVARGLGEGWGAALVCADPALARAAGLPFGPGLPTLNGGISVRIFAARAA